MIKKNQIVIFAIAVMLIAAGYLNYKVGNREDAIATSTMSDSTEMAGLGDAKLVNSNAVDESRNNEGNEIKENRNC